MTECPIAEESGMDMPSAPCPGLEMNYSKKRLLKTRLRSIQVAGLRSITMGCVDNRVLVAGTVEETDFGVCTICRKHQ